MVLRCTVVVGFRCGGLLSPPARRLAASRIRRIVTCYRTEVREEKVPVTIEKVSYQKEVLKVKVTVYVPKWFEEKVRTSYYVPIPKIIEREVPVCVMVPVVLVDPCTGCCFVTCREQMAMKKVQTTVCDYRMEAQGRAR